jgi:16S rRNA (guanine(1405)-N(7))-methyltransferase
MALPAGSTYTAVDIYTDLAEFLNGFFRLLPGEGLALQGEALARDVLEFEPGRMYDLALALKAIPCLEQVDKTAGSRLLDHLPARWLIVSFPVSSLGGRNKGMVVNYGAAFESLLAKKGWPAQRLDLPGELVYRIEKPI